MGKAKRSRAVRLQPIRLLRSSVRIMRHRARVVTVASSRFDERVGGGSCGPLRRLGTYVIQLRTQGEVDRHGDGSRKNRLGVARVAAPQMAFATKVTIPSGTAPGTYYVAMPARPMITSTVPKARVGGPVEVLAGRHSAGGATPQRAERLLRRHLRQRSEPGARFISLSIIKPPLRTKRVSKIPARSKNTMLRKVV